MPSHTIEKAKPTTVHLPAFFCRLLVLLLAMQAQGQSVHQLSYNNANWSDLDLGTSSLTGIAAFTTTPDNGLHVFYCSASDHVIQNYNVGGGWAAEDLTAETGGASSTCDFAGFSQQNLQYVFYKSLSDLHIHELFYNNFGWSDSDLTAETGGPQSGLFLRSISALTTSAKKHLHVYYTTDSGHIIHYYTVKNKWVSEDVSAKSGVFADGVNIASLHIGQVQYLYFVSNQHIHELVYKNSVWKDKDLTALTNSTPVDLGEVAAMVVPGSKQLSIYAIDTNHHVIQLASTNDKHWTSLDLTSLTGGPSANNEYTGIVAYATTPNNDIHVYYISGFGSAIQTYNVGTGWITENLTDEAKGPLALDGSGVAGFSVQNYQFVYYVGND